jgi:hypothetical protein
MAYISLPVVAVQRDFCDVIRDVDEGVVAVDRFWASCYKMGEVSVHAKVEVELDEVKRDLVRFRPKEGGVEFAKTESVSELHLFMVQRVSSCDDEGIPSRMQISGYPTDTAFIVCSGL